MTTNTYAEPALHPEDAPHGASRSCPTAADATLEFGRFRVLLRQRQLVADGVPIELGTRAFELLLALLEADGALVTKDELLRRAWPGIFVAEDNLKIQILNLRRALGDDRDLICTEFGRGYRFTAAVHATTARSVCDCPPLRRRRSFKGQFVDRLRDGCCARAVIGTLRQEIRHTATEAIRSGPPHRDDSDST